VFYNFTEELNSDKVTASEIIAEVLFIIFYFENYHTSSIDSKFEILRLDILKGCKDRFIIYLENEFIIKATLLNFKYKNNKNFT